MKNKRKVEINNNDWFYRIGRKHVEIWAPYNEKIVVSFTKLFGFDWNTLRRGKHKGSTSATSITALDIKKYVVDNISENDCRSKECSGSAKRKHKNKQKHITKIYSLSEYLRKSGYAQFRSFSA